MRFWSSTVDTHCVHTETDDKRTKSLLSSQWGYRRIYQSLYRHEGWQTFEIRQRTTTLEISRIITSDCRTLNRFFAAATIRKRAMTNIQKCHQKDVFVISRFGGKCCRTSALPLRCLRYCALRAKKKASTMSCLFNPNYDYHSSW